MDNYIKAAELPYPDRFLEGKLISAQVRQAKVITNYSTVNIISGMVLPSDGKALVRDATTTALARISRAAIAVELYRHARGRLPESLTQLVPEFASSVPMDPFDGLSLRYKQLPKGFAIYSVGEDERDDGGQEMPDLQKPQGSGDITFVVQR